MADTGIFATTAEVARKSGTGASATSVAEAYVNQYMTEVEAHINSVTRFNWSDAYAALNADTKGLLKEGASNLAAIYVIIWDMSGYTSRIEAEDIINTLRDRALEVLSILRDKKVKEFVDKA